MNRYHALCCVAALLLAGPVLAIDRNAASIESVIVQGSSFEKSDGVSIGAWSETALDSTHRQWAIVAGGDFGWVSVDEGDSSHEWGVAVGVKLYVEDLTSFALTGHYRSGGMDSDMDTIAGMLTAKQRFISADEVISPFVVLSASLGRLDFESASGSDRDDTIIALTAQIGCDFMMATDMAISFQGGVSQSQDLDGGLDELEDGFIASVAMVYYWP